MVVVSFFFLPHPRQKPPSYPWSSHPSLFPRRLRRRPAALPVPPGEIPQVQKRLFVEPCFPPTPHPPGIHESSGPPRTTNDSVGRRYPPGTIDRYMHRARSTGRYASRPCPGAVNALARSSKGAMRLSMSVTILCRLAASSGEAAAAPGPLLRKTRTGAAALFPSPSCTARVFVAPPCAESLDVEPRRPPPPHSFAPPIHRARHLQRRMPRQHWLIIVRMTPMFRRSRWVRGFNSARVHHLRLWVIPGSDPRAPPDRFPHRHLGTAVPSEVCNAGNTRSKGRYDRRASSPSIFRLYFVHLRIPTGHKTLNKGSKRVRIVVLRCDSPGGLLTASRKFS